jgi:hypothetical protein
MLRGARAPFGGFSPSAGRRTIAGVGCRTFLAAACALLSLLAAATAGAASGQLRVPQDVRSVSWFPAQGGWTLTWTRFDPDAIERDFRRIAWLRANTVRVIVPPRAFGYPEPDAQSQARLARVVAAAARHGLHVELTLFDWWHDYADVAGSRRWAEAVLAPYAGDPRIALVELKNELQPQDEGAVAWAAELIPHLRATARKPVTVSVPAVEPARDLRLLREGLGASQPDFYSAHLYWRPGLAEAHLRAARAAVAPLPLRLGETGYSTAPGYAVIPGVPASAAAREAQQAYYLRSLALIARRLGLPPISPWVLSDFAPGAIPGDDPDLHVNPREYRFGLFRVSGKAKPAAHELRAIFSGRRFRAFNGGFEHAVADGLGGKVPALWLIRAAPHAAFAHDPHVARTGRGSARIAGAGGPTGPDAAFAIAPPDPGVRAGYRATVAAWARADADCGEVRLALQWLAADGRPLGRSQSYPLRCGRSEWRRLRASGRAPSGAASVVLELRAAGTAGAAWFDDVRYCGGPGVPCAAGTRSLATKNPAVPWTCGSVSTSSGRLGCR